LEKNQNKSTIKF